MPKPPASVRAAWIGGICAIVAAVVGAAAAYTFRGHEPDRIAVTSPTPQPAPQNALPSPDPEDTHDKKVLTEQSQKIEGNDNVTVGPISGVGGNVVVNPPPKRVKRTVLNNEDSPTLILKTIHKDSPLDSVADPENFLGTVAVGTEVKVIDDSEIPSGNPFLVFQEIEMLSGPLKGKRGWVSRNTIRTIETSE